MGLKLVNDKEVVYLLGRNEVDSWGISSTKSNKTAIPCSIKGAEDSTPISSIGGKQVVPSYIISFNFQQPLQVGDILEVGGTQYSILSKKELKDLSKKILITRVTI